MKAAGSPAGNRMTGHGLAGGAQGGRQRPGGRRSAAAMSAGERRAAADARAVIRCSVLGGAEARPPSRRFVSLARAAAAAVLIPGISSSLRRKTAV